MAPSRGRCWNTPLGHAIIQHIVKAKIPGWKDGLFGWQLIIVAWILDGEEALVVTTTGDGKSALFMVPIIVLLEVAANPAAYPGFVNHKKPVGIVISPTKGLSANMVSHLPQFVELIPAASDLATQITELSGHGVQGLSCTSETLTEARKSGRNLGEEIRWPIVCIDPEHLTEKQWERITDSELFHENLAFICVDEAHLIDNWGDEFHPAFRHIGPFIRGRLLQHIAVFAMTATLQPGPPTRSICRSLGFQKDMFHLVRRSNERRNIQFLLSPLTHGLGCDTFPDLLRAPSIVRPSSSAGMSTFTSCGYSLRVDSSSGGLIRDEPDCQVVVVTVTFGQGFDIRVLLDSLMLGVPKTVAQTLQQAGRVVRDQTSNGRAVVFVQSTAYKSAEKYLAQDPARRAKAKQNNKSLTTMNNEKVLMLTAKECLIAFFNKMFGNTGNTVLLNCIEGRQCLPCSNCLPRFIGPLNFPPSPYPPDAPPLAPFPSTDFPPAVIAAVPKKTRKLTKAMRVSTESELRLFRERVHKTERDRVSHGYTPASSYLPNPSITAILNHFLTISTVETLTTVTPKWKYRDEHGPALIELIKGLQTTFELEFEAARLQKNAVNRTKAKAKHQICRMKKCQGKRRISTRQTHLGR
ncbi:P-loop containing nucleoside triphosphate hydrolase protein [Mycena maculata]|uniref:P-loop containing nucleoside triphosphate hydrolase protein n=1 Tax=Mycena maculata TaxID=230809 RepID=A0AAD7MVE3_9AGAR|nr:P-loop containing nucleoside triphosphate hydrolase protein [Mycena maculata]